MKLKHLAAAVAFAAAGSANAAIATGGNGELIFALYDNIGGTTTSGVFDLGILFDSMVGAAGNGTNVVAGTLETSYIQWNFLDNSINIDGAVTANYGDWTGAWNTVLANSDANDLRFITTAIDSTGIGVNRRSMVTGVLNPTVQQLTNQNAGQAAAIQLIGSLNNVFHPQQSRGTHATAENGAFTFTADLGDPTRANGYFNAGDGFGNEWRNGNKLNGETFASNQTGLWLIDGSGAERLLGTLNLDVAAGTLTYNIVAAPVPEPEAYAMLLAGLGMIGFMARRRRAA